MQKAYPNCYGNLVVTIVEHGYLINLAKEADFCVRFLGSSLFVTLFVKTRWTLSSPPFLFDWISSSSLLSVTCDLGGIRSSPCFLLDENRSSSVSRGSIQSLTRSCYSTASVTAVVDGVFALLGGDVFRQALTVFFSAPQLRGILTM